MSETQVPPRLINVLLVEDDPGDVLLTKKALGDSKVLNTIDVVQDGIEALEYLRAEDEPRPDLILLDLNMPRKDGRETLAEIKADPELRSIPVVILTTSDRDEDIIKTYDLQASCYISKPVDLSQFSKVVKTIETFWLCVVKYPGRTPTLPPAL